MKYIITDELTDKLIEDIVNMSSISEGGDIMYPIKTDKLVMTSGYGKRTYTYNGKKITDFHNGIDLVGGDEIVAVADGVVIKVVNKGSKGGTMCQIRIKHKDYETAYYHNKSGSAKVKVGDYVKKGQVIALVGSTGKVTGKHLHFQIDKGSNSTSINPYNYVFGDKEVKGISLGEYKVESPRYIRTGAGTEYRIKKVGEVSTYAQEHAVNKKKTANAQLEKGTILEALDITKGRNNNSIWCRTYSGYICLMSSTGKEYCIKV